MPVPESLTGDQRSRKRSVAWIYYSILTVVFLYAGVAVSPGGFVLALLMALYARYLYRGGRVVFWFW
jgi:hypothetical protein